MKLMLKMRESLRRVILEDLRRPHEFAFERVGFIACHAATIKEGLLILAASYQGVADKDYVQDPNVGARINGTALRAALQTSLDQNAGMFHVHSHEHKGQPIPSSTDRRESRKFVPDFFNVTPNLPHGTLILSEDSATGYCWLGSASPPEIFNQIIFCGTPLQLIDIRA
jgi:hypothetical protein